VDNKTIKGFEIQKKFSMDVNGKHICNHFVDFWVERPDGTFEAHETKGMKTATWRIKYKLFLALYPGIEYIIVT